MGQKRGNFKERKKRGENKKASLLLKGPRMGIKP